MALPPDSFDFSGFRTEGARDFARYWLSLPRVEEGLPSQRDFDPVEIRHLLHHVILHDVTVENQSLLRIVGSALVERFGFNPTGRDYGTLVNPDRRDAAIGALFTAAYHPCGMHVVLEWRYQNGQRQMAEALGFPLIRRDGKGRLLMFVDISLETTGYEKAHGQDVRALGVSERQMIDIGSGVPE